jgi:hypothetical protein
LIFFFFFVLILILFCALIYSTYGFRIGEESGSD